MVLSSLQLRQLLDRKSEVEVIPEFEAEQKSEPD
jgi:hypothetical protein